MIKHFIALSVLIVIIFSAIFGKISASDVSSKVYKVYLEDNYLGEKECLYIKHNKFAAEVLDQMRGVKIYENFYPLQKEFFCYKMIRKNYTTEHSSHNDVSAYMLYKIDKLEHNKRCSEENNEI